MRRTSFRFIRIHSRPGRHAQGWLSRPGPFKPLQVALGRGGIKASKREGDGGTPAGSFRPVRLWFRPDRLPRPRTLLPVRGIRPDDAWCEDPSDRRYNHAFRRSANEPGDRLRRDDGLYDLIVEIDHNTRPRVPGRGSAVFIHVARDRLAPTAGCVALQRQELLQLVRSLSPKTRIIVHS
ncbi:MAG TPA: L,D-transpeptidase family protein [Xanthobacteraceae bacterium]|nr:L,D-transpeptidase family protein [Xanthobacteraceae bacterium]